MKSAAAMLRGLTAFCIVAFLRFAVAGLAVPSDRGSLHASATAFLVGAVLAFAAGRSHAEVVRRVERLEQLAEDRKRPETGTPNDR
jgi:hypothetical protein